MGLVEMEQLVSAVVAVVDGEHLAVQHLVVYQSLVRVVKLST
jgi:hypothetical protein